MNRTMIVALAGALSMTAACKPESARKADWPRSRS